jgi:hypothetical protein
MSCEIWTLNDARCAPGDKPGAELRRSDVQHKRERPADVPACRVSHAALRLAVGTLVALTLEQPGAVI